MQVLVLGFSLQVLVLGFGFRVLVLGFGFRLLVLGFRFRVTKIALFTGDLHHITMRTQNLEICGDSFVL